MENAKDIIFGGVYKLADNAEEILRKKGYRGNYFDGNDQSYGYFLPVAVEMPCNTGNNEVFIYMIDTYVIDRPHYDDFEELVEAIKSWRNPENGCRIRNQSFNYYHSGAFRLTDDIAPAFELVCDLSKVKPIYSDEAVKYEDGDVFWNVKLYHTHNFSWEEGTKGVILAKKNASPTGERSLKAVLDKIVRTNPDELGYMDIALSDELQTTLNMFPWLSDEHSKEIEAAKDYLKAVRYIYQLREMTLSPYRNVIGRYVNGENQPDLVVQTEAGKIVAREENDEYKGIGLYFFPNGYTDLEPLALAECHDDPDKRVADETCDDVMMYTYTDDFGKPIKHVRSLKAINQHYTNLETVRPLTPEDEESVKIMDYDSGFSVADMLDAENYAYGIFDEDGFLDGYCTLGDVDGCMPEFVTKDKLYDPEDSLLLSDVYVDPHLRKHGYATKLIREAIKQKFASKQMKPSVYLTIINDDVEKLYEKIGFKFIEPFEEGFMVLDPKEFR